MVSPIRSGTGKPTPGRSLQGTCAPGGISGYRPTVFGVADSATRQLPVDTFPYQVVFKRFQDRTSVLAIAHERKRPAYWEK